MCAGGGVRLTHNWTQTHAVDKKLAETDKDPRPKHVLGTPIPKLSNIPCKEEVEKKTPKLSVYGSGVSAVE